MVFKISSLKEGPTDDIGLRPHAAWRCLWCYLLLWVFSYWPYAQCKLGTGCKWEPALFLLHWFFLWFDQSFGWKLSFFHWVWIAIPPGLSLYFRTEILGLFIIKIFRFSASIFLTSSSCWSTLTECEENWPIHQRNASITFLWP